MPPSIDRSNLALGKQKPINAPALVLRDFLTGVTPSTPQAADHFAKIGQWNLGRNNEFGTCGPTAVSNHLLLTTAYLTKPVRVTTEDIFDLYRRSGNPNFDPATGADDNGVIVQKMLGALLSGGIGGHKPLAFAKISPGDMDTLDKAIAIFGGILLGLDLKVPQQNQQTWTYVSGAEWGGHAVMAGRYANPDGTSQDRTGIITWAEVIDMTRSFVQYQEDEAWVIIWPEHLGSAAFLEGVDVSALASAYQDLTGRPFPVAPSPQPAPTPAPDAGDVDAALEMALRRTLKGTGVPKYLRGPAQAWVDRRG